MPTSSRHLATLKDDLKADATLMADYPAFKDDLANLKAELATHSSSPLKWGVSCLYFRRRRRN